MEEYYSYAKIGLLVSNHMQRIEKKLQLLGKNKDKVEGEEDQDAHNKRTASFSHDL